LRVQIVSGSNTLYYLHSDHLGSTSLATNTSGVKIPGSDSRYYPFGDWRTEPTANLTDRGFTGHLHNNIGSGPDDIGLVYMQARWFLPATGRFASADTIIPNPANPQSYNRYSYVRNSPLNLIDPTGHRECDMDLNCDNPLQPEKQPEDPLIIFKAVDGHTWTEAEKIAVRSGAWAVARALYEAGGGQFSSPREAFLTIYGGTITFNKTGTECAEGCYGRWSGSNNTINVYNNSYDKNEAGEYDFSKSLITSPSTGHRWAVHELGHGFEAKVNNVLGSNDIRDNLPAHLANRDGFAGPAYGWQQSECAIDCNGEIFADMFLGWTYGQWDTGDYVQAGQAKANFMANTMSTRINLIVSP
jgi:RHS repeat-associated protein